MAIAELSPNQLKRKSRKQRKGIYDKKLCYVYGLADQYGRVRYVGQTRCTLKQRLSMHKRDSRKGNSPVQKWFRETERVQIFMIDGNATWDVSEIIYIERFRQAGHDLKNVLRGGADTCHAMLRESD